MNHQRRHISKKIACTVASWIHQAPSLAVVATLACAAPACSDDDDFGPQRVTVMMRDADTGEYGLHEDDLNSLESARKIRGGAARLRGGGALIIEEALFSGQLTADREEQVHEFELVTGDAAVRAQYERRHGVLVPADWESLLMFSFYRHMERGQAFFASLGGEPEQLQPLVAHFNVRFTAMLLAWGQPLVTDNAGYVPLADAFLLFPTSLLSDGIPLVANEGVVVHELSHAFKHHILHGDQHLPRYLTDKWPERAVSHYRADDEGLADFFAATLLNDANFIAPSILGIDIDRDISIDRPFTQKLYDASESPSLVYNPYALGSALASWLWDMGADSDGRLVLATAIVTTLNELRDTIDGSYRITHLIAKIIEVLEVDAADMAARGCVILDERLEGDFRNVEPCGI